MSAAALAVRKMKQRATSAAWAASRSGEEGAEEWEAGSTQGGSPLPRAKDLARRIEMAQVTAIVAAAAKVDVRIVVWRGPPRGEQWKWEGRTGTTGFRPRSLHAVAGE